MLPHRRMAVVYWSRIARGAKDGSEPHTGRIGQCASQLGADPMTVSGS